jgi:exodeoxyribonuclease VII small subunit
MVNSKPVEKLKYEEAFSELETIVASLEAGDQTVDEATTVFARGQALVKHCAWLLERAELKVQQLSAEEIKDPEDAE